MYSSQTLKIFLQMLKEFQKFLICTLEWVPYHISAPTEVKSGMQGWTCSRQISWWAVQQISIVGQWTENKLPFKLRYSLLHRKRQMFIWL